MNKLTCLLARFRWANLSTATLIALLQRTPVLRLLAPAGEFAGGPPAGAWIQSALAAAASLGALDSLAGATVLSSSQTSPITATSGAAITPVVYTVTNTINIGSWNITGTIPPGLTLTALEGGASLNGPGVLDATTAGTPGMDDGYGGTTGGTAGNTVTTPKLSGTPTATGSYTFNLQAYEYGAETGLVSGTFPFTVNVVAGGTAAVAPNITTAPQGQTVAAGASLTLSVSAAGTPTPTYQWNLNGAAISGATSSSYAVATVTSANAGSYTVTVTNSAGSVTSNAAVVTVTVALPSFVAQPLSVSVATGATVALTAAATGAPSYQWSRGGVPISGGTSSTLLISGATAANAGTYTCTAVTSAGSVVSNAATLAVISTSDVGRLTNLSTRAQVGTGANVLIAGFAIGGSGTSGTKPILVRGTGPALTGFGVSGALPDPALTLFQSSTTVASNSGWAGNAQVTAADAAVGAFALTNTSSLDSALYLSGLASAAYSAQIAGKSGDTGVALAEVYDATPVGTYTLATPRLTNLSARVQVGTGSNVLIAGFVIGGSSAKTVLVRASGPALVPFGLTGTLPDPQLQLFNGTVLLATNNGWGGNPQVASVAASVGAFAWTTASSNDSAMLLTLPPGSYSAQVAGASGDTGVALVEVYEVP